MSSQIKIQKDMERNFKPNKNDRYLKDARIKKYEQFLGWVFREGAWDEFTKYFSSFTYIKKT